MSQAAIERGIRPPSGTDIASADRIYRNVLTGIIPGVREHARSLKQKAIFALGGGLGLLEVACGSGTPISQPNPEQPTATEPARATATAVGIGANFVPTGNAEIDNIQKRLLDPATKAQVSEEDILKFNDATLNRANATATAEAQAQKTPTPEGKTRQCDILSPEACATGEYIEWTRPDGEKLKGIGFILKPGEEIKYPKEGLLVSAILIQQPSVYRGVQVIARTKDGSETYAYYGNFNLDKIKASDLPPNTVGIIADSDLTVFEGQPYNLVFASSPVLETFAPISKGPLKRINNKVPENPASNTAFFYGITPPK